ncbi:hypothetical protein WA026_006873 [Henosepilachna vigintioctopunctata]|uniref:Uncharacterized protein n=1 Tax=Henosepilachna vigintioctopunctata TaxID=420089 RepID=A0AAW1V2M2_9CUCU
MGNIQDNYIENPFTRINVSIIIAIVFLRTCVRTKKSFSSGRKHVAFSTMSAATDKRARSTTSSREASETTDEEDGPPPYTDAESS